MGITGENCCNCKADKKSDDLFSRGKMKVLKKIKKRMGLAPRSGSSAANTNNVPPLLFHTIHGDNVRISRDGTVARRVESFCKGIAFSARPVKVNEKICIKFIEISNNWSGVIRFGFTYNDPSTLRHGLPKYACPDLTNKPGYWAKALAERFCSQNTILFYYVTSAGDVHFGINGEEKGIFFGGVETRGPLWALIDIYGNSTGIEFVDVRQELNNSRRNVAATSATCDSNGAADVDRLILPLQSVSIHQRNENADLPMLRYQSQPQNFSAFPLHATRGRNVRFNNNRSIASRVDTEFCQGYVFTGRPLHLGERVVIQIMATEPMYAGALALGLTSCDPVSLQIGELPDDSDLLLDRPEYWVVSKDVASHPIRGDEISFSISHTGEVQISKNGSHPITVMHVDQTLKLWAFFDIYGSTQTIRVLSSLPQASPGRVSAAPDRRFIIPASSESMNSLNSQSEQIRRNMQPANVAAVPVCVAPTDLIHLQQNANGGAVLVVNLPPPTQTTVLAQQQSVVLASSAPHLSHSHHSSQSSILSNHHNHNNQHLPLHGSSLSQSQQQQSHSQAVHHAAAAASVPIAQTPVPTPPVPKVMPVPTGTMMSTYSNTYIEPVSSATYSTLPLRGDQAGAAAGAECTICYEHPIDSVLYMCGHMCMCYECALQQWRGKGGGHCPLCRAVIRDVIRTYKS